MFCKPLNGMRKHFCEFVPQIGLYVSGIKNQINRFLVIIYPYLWYV